MCSYICRFKEGILCLGVFQEVMQNPEAMKPLFTHCDHKLDSVHVDSLFRVIFSEEGSNRRRGELRTQVHWRDFLQDLEGVTILLFGKLLFY